MKAHSNVSYHVLQKAALEQVHLNSVTFVEGACVISVGGFLAYASKGQSQLMVCDLQTFVLLVACVGKSAIKINCDSFKVQM